MHDDTSFTVPHCWRGYTVLRVFSQLRRVRGYGREAQYHSRVARLYALSRASVSDGSRRVPSVPGPRLSDAVAIIERLLFTELLELPPTSTDFFFSSSAAAPPPRPPPGIERYRYRCPEGPSSTGQVRVLPGEIRGSEGGELVLMSMQERRGRKRCSSCMTLSCTCVQYSRVGTLVALRPWPWPEHQHGIHCTSSGDRSGGVRLSCSCTYFVPRSEGNSVGRQFLFAEEAHYRYSTSNAPLRSSGVP